jgi:N-acetylmuramoyl-L-alanine amidase
MENKKIIILGTAHGINTAGKRSPDGKFREYKFSRTVVAKVKTKLETLGYKVFVDITDDVVPASQSIELKRRVNIVNNYCKQYGTSNCLYVSIHVNAAGHGTWLNARGFSVFVSPNSSLSSKKLAKMFTMNAIRDGLSGNRSIPYEKYWTSNLYVLRNTNCPAVLTENLFQDNKEDVAFLMSEKGVETIVNLHVNSINEYCTTI